MKQRTVCCGVLFEGVGIHTGEISRIRIHPEPEDTGIRFLRKGVYIPARPESVVNTSHSTDLGEEGVVVRTVEHLMATFHLLGITNATVEVLRGEEIPILDGSGYWFYKELKNKVIKQDKDAQVMELESPLEVKSGGSRIKALPCRCFEVTYEGEFRTYFGKQRFTFRGNVRDIILARTFCFEHEIEFIRKKGLGRGGSLENTLVIGEGGVFNVGGLRYDNEPVRHKVLDLIGDLYLLGASVRGRFISYKGGHTLNLALVKALHRRAVLV